tara:strand:+ start:614 stop:1018 length:405 start_codon:yes stop_codon:yes gene_type:complete
VSSDEVNDETRATHGLVRLGIFQLEINRGIASGRQRCGTPRAGSTSSQQTHFLDGGQLRNVIEEWTPPRTILKATPLLDFQFVFSDTLDRRRVSSSGRQSEFTKALKHTFAGVNVTTKAINVEETLKIGIVRLH